MKLNDYFIYNKKERKEILIFLFIVIAGLLIYHSISFEEEDIIDLDSPKVLAIIKEMDSLTAVSENQKKQRKIYSFNPNYITDFRGYMLGMSPEEIDRLLEYRKEGKWINSVQEFQSVTRVSDSLLATFSDSFKFPEWVTNPKESSKSTAVVPKEVKERNFAQKIDLNLATVEELQQVSGIGKVLSERIVQYRTKLDGFSEDSQLYQVYGLDTAVVGRALKLFTVKTPKVIVKININKASASDLATVSGISYELAKNIWEYRKLRGTVDNIEELLKVKGMTPSKFEQIQLYLSLE